MRYSILVLCVLSMSCLGDGTSLNAPDIGTSVEPDGGSEVTDAAVTADTAEPDVTLVEPDEGPKPPAPQMLGGSRPAKYFLPLGGATEEAMPLIILLHGFSADSNWQNSYFGLNVETQKRGIMLITPEGTKNPDDNQFWNATDSCCNYYQSDIDDVAYIAGLIEEAQVYFNIDTDRVYLIGHSNGGYMSYRMACDRSDLIAGIVSFAGTTWYDASDCGDPGPVSVLHVHGDWDADILYEGKEKQVGNPFAQWTPIDTCLGTQCTENLFGCTSNEECNALYSCYGTCAGNPDYFGCIGQCWNASTDAAKVIWWGTYICGLNEGCYDDPTRSWPGYASAEESVRRWAVRNGCGDTMTDGTSMDLVYELPDDDTFPSSYDNCPEDLGAELWKIPYGGHIPGFNDNWGSAIVDWLLKYKKVAQ